MIKAVLWDLGGVLCRFHPDRRLHEIARRSAACENDVRALLTSEVLGGLDAGEMTGAELLTAVHAQLEWHCTIDDLGTAWAAAFEPDPSSLNVARRVVVPAAVLTNNGPPLSDHYRELLPAVAAVVPRALFSGHTGVTKPNVAAFVGACAALDAAPSDVLLIDDSIVNVAAASRAGLQTHHYRRVELLERFLDRHRLQLF